MEPNNTTPEINQNQTSQDAPQDFSSDNKNVAGPLIGIIVIIAIIVIGGLYFWLMRQKQNALPANNQSTSTTTSSDSVSSLEADLQANQVGSIDSDLSSIDQAFSQ